MTIDAGILDQVTQQFLTVLKKDGALIQHVALSLIYYLAILQLSLSALWMVLAGESLQRFLTNLVQQCFTFGFMFALIQYGSEWIPNIINGFIDVGQKGGVQSLDPSSILQQGVTIAGGIFQGFFNWGLLAHPFVSVAGSAILIVIIIIYSFIAAELTILLIKSYVLVALGSLFFAFGVFDFTQAMMRNFINAVIGLSLQLMTLYLLLGVGQTLGADWIQMTQHAADQHLIVPMLTIMAAAIVYYLVVKNVPSFVAGLSGVGGFRNYGDAAVAVAMNTGVSTANLLTNTARSAGRGAQGLAEAGIAAKHLYQGGMHAGSSQQETMSAVGAGIKNAVSTAMSATFSAAKDAAMRTNQQKTFGQKFNEHAANKVKSHKEGKSDERKGNPKHD